MAESICETTLVPSHPAALTRYLMARAQEYLDRGSYGAARLALLRAADSLHGVEERGEC